METQRTADEHQVMLDRRLQNQLDEERRQSATLVFGTHLTNGFTVIAYRRNVVLAGRSRLGGADEFATWNVDPTRPDSTTSGHYFAADILGAAADFEVRSK